MAKTTKRDPDKVEHWRLYFNDSPVGGGWRYFVLMGDPVGGRQRVYYVPHLRVFWLSSAEVERAKGHELSQQVATTGLATRIRMSRAARRRWRKSEGGALGVTRNVSWSVTATRQLLENLRGAGDVRTAEDEAEDAAELLDVPADNSDDTSRNTDGEDDMGSIEALANELDGKAKATTKKATTKKAASPKAASPKATTTKKTMPVSPKATTAKKAASPKAGRTSLPDTTTIKVKVKENPAREGTLQARAFDKIKDGMSVADFVKATASFTRGPAEAKAILRHQAGRGHIDLK